MLMQELNSPIIYILICEAILPPGVFLVCDSYPIYFVQI